MLPSPLWPQHGLLLLDDHFPSFDTFFPLSANKKHTPFYNTPAYLVYTRKGQQYLHIVIVTAAWLQGVKIIIKLILATEVQKPGS